MEDNKDLNEKKSENLTDEQMKDVSAGYLGSRARHNNRNDRSPGYPVKFLVREDVMQQVGAAGDDFRSKYMGKWVDAVVIQSQYDVFFTINVNLLPAYNRTLSHVPYTLIKKC